MPCAGHVERASRPARGSRRRQARSAPVGTGDTGNRHAAPHPGGARPVHPVAVPHVAARGARGWYARGAMPG
eukprot:6039862-Prymnesium_polylepis.1